MTPQVGPWGILHTGPSTAKARGPGHMDEARSAPGGGRWFARFDRVTLVLKCARLSASDAGGAALSDEGRWNLMSEKDLRFVWTEASPQQSTAHGHLKCSGHGRTGANRPPPPEAGFAQREPSGFPKPHQTVRFGGLLVSASADLLLLLFSLRCAAPRTFKPSHPPPRALTFARGVAGQPLHLLDVLPRLVLHVSSSFCCWSEPQARRLVCACGARA